MKKRITLLLAAVMCLLLVACGEVRPTAPTTAPSASGTSPTQPTACSHLYTEEVSRAATCAAAGERTFTCAKCGQRYYEEIPILAHSYGDATCDVPKTCPDCGATEGQALGHREEILPGKAATVTEDGLSEGRVCTVCDAVLAPQTVLPATGSPGLEYEANKGGTWTVTGLGSCTDSWVIIPSYHEGKAVTAIAERAFADCAAMTEITIPATVKNIGEGIFENCTALHTVYYNSTYFSWFNPFLDGGSMKKVVFGGAFVPPVCYQTSGVREVVVLDGVTQIKEFAFSGSTGLERVTIGKDVTKIGKNAFTDCTALVGVNIPEGVRRIGRYTFSGCTSLEHITIPRGVISIDGFAFSGCSGLKSVSLASSVTSIGVSAFRDCSSLEKIVIPYGVERIDNGTFMNCTSLTDVTIPGSVTAIYGFTDHGAFQGCSSLRQITIPAGVTSIGMYTFSGCGSLESITIPDSVTRIEWYVFRDCGSLERIHFKGTTQQWEAILKDLYWDNNTGTYTIHCTDGDIPKK